MPSFMSPLICGFFAAKAESSSSRSISSVPSSWSVVAAASSGAGVAFSSTVAAGSCAIAAVASIASIVAGKLFISCSPSC